MQVCNLETKPWKELASKFIIKLLEFSTLWVFHHKLWSKISLHHLLYIQKARICLSDRGRLVMGKYVALLMSRNELKIYV